MICKLQIETDSLQNNLLTIEQTIKSLKTQQQKHQLIQKSLEVGECLSFWNQNS